MGYETTGFGGKDEFVGPDGTEYRLEKPEEDEKEEYIEYDGNRYYPVPGYTLRTYYSHFTDGIGPGPGWDSQTVLLDDKRSKALYGRTFTEEEVYHPEKLPDIPVYRA